MAGEASQCNVEVRLHFLALVSIEIAQKRVGACLGPAMPAGPRRWCQTSGSGARAAANLRGRRESHSIMGLAGLTVVQWATQLIPAVVFCKIAVS